MPNNPMFDMYGAYVVGVFAALEVETYLGLQGIISFDQGEGNKDSLASQLLDSIPCYRSGDVKQAEAYLAINLAMGLSRAEERQRQRVEPLFQET